MKNLESELNFSWTKDTHKVTISNGFEIYFNSQHEYPNAFHRLVMRLLLGWKWERL